MAARLQGIDWRRAAWWLPVAVASVYAVMVLLQIGTITHQIWWDSDSSEAGVFAQLHGTAPAGTYSSIGYHGWYAQLGFMLLTKALPGHRLIWYSAPYVVGLIGLAALWWSAARCFGRYAAALAVSALVIVGANALYAFLQPTAHGLTITAAALTCAGAVWLLPGATSARAPRLLVGAAVIGVIGGLPLAGDSLYWIWGVLPMLIALGLFVWRSDRPALVPAATFAGIVVVLNLVVAKLVSASMVGMGFHTWKQGLQQLLTFSTPNLFVDNLKAVLTGLPWLYGGFYFGAPINFTSIAELVGAALVIAGVIAVLLRALRLVGELARGEQPDLDLPIEAEHVEPPTDPELGAARLIHTSFWATTLVAGLATFLLGNPLYAGSIGGIGPARYLIGPLAATGALLPWLMQRGTVARAWIAAALALLGVTACIVLQAVTPGWYLSHPSAYNVSRLKAFAAAEGVKYGYGSYWVTMNTTWYTGFRLQLYPIRRCGPPVPVHYCASPTVSMYSWYRPRAGVRSMFVSVKGDMLVTHPPAAWGKPIARRRFGELQVWVYPFDIAAFLNTKLLHEAETNTLPKLQQPTLPLNTQ